MLEFPDNTDAATVYFQWTTVILQSTGTILPPQKQQKAQSCPEYIARMPPSSRWSIEHITDFRYAREVADSIRDGTCIAIANGSYKNDFGTAQFILQAPDPLHRLKAPLRCPGDYDDACAYRSEETGLYGIGNCAKMLCEQYNIANGKITYGCDNDTALHNSHQELVTSPKHPHFDILMATRKVMSSCPIQWCPQEVKGHHDNEDGDHELNIYELLNCECDEGAKAFWYFCTSIEDTQPIWEIEHEPWSLWINGKKICTKLDEAIRTAVDGRNILDYWKKKYPNGIQGVESTDWDALGKSLAAVKLS